MKRPSVPETVSPPLTGHLVTGDVPGAPDAITIDSRNPNRGGVPWCPIVPDGENVTVYGSGDDARVPLYPPAGAPVFPSPHVRDRAFGQAPEPVSASLAPVGRTTFTVDAR
ncbi:hypothetical protein [Streptosporangium sp. NPDC048865]|uniref:hypothetical protein n=1 Tax=Streptosporangium sp. NPDC048865 TaxID=3155766 RepID=UPI0034274CF1